MVNNWSLLLVGLIGIIVNFLLLNENLYAYMALHVVCQCWRGTGTEVHVRIKVFIQQEEFHNDANKFHREQRPVVGHKGHRSIGKDDR